MKKILLTISLVGLVPAITCATAAQPITTSFFQRHKQHISLLAASSIIAIGATNGFTYFSGKFPSLPSSSISLLTFAATAPAALTTHTVCDHFFDQSSSRSKDLITRLQKASIPSIAGGAAAISWFALGKFLETKGLQTTPTHMLSKEAVIVGIGTTWLVAHLVSPSKNL